MKTLKGIGASAGITKAKAFILKNEEIKISKKKIKSSKDEVKVLNNAISVAKKQIENLKKIATKKLGEEKAAIFDAHLGILLDPAINDEAINIINTSLVNASFAYKQVADQFISLFSQMDDEYMRERVADIKDVSNRVLKIIEKIEIKDLSLINEEVVIIAHDLTPSETSQLNPKYVKAFVTEIGGRTSHSAIMARTLEIPAIVGVGKKVFDIKHRENLLVDGIDGVIYIAPDLKTSAKLLKKASDLEKKKKEMLNFKNKHSVSLDSWQTELAANIGSPEDLPGVINNGAEGVGLFRSEFLYMDSQNWPTEEEQFEAYKKVVSTLNPKRVVIRTLDIGGDKTLSYFKFPHEMNPFLGYRAVRLQLDKKDILITQARALLRASAFGKLAINVPMIATIEEFKEVQKVFKQVETQLLKEKIKFGKYELGIMVEIPSTVEIIDKFAKYADFFSIGTNDLIQYTFAADRMSEKVAYLYQPFNPAILRKIKRVIDESHKAGKWTAICGEMAGEILLAPIFVGMGLDEFSMSATSILEIRRLISKLDKKECEKLVAKVLDCETETEVIKLINKFINDKKIIL